MHTLFHYIDFLSSFVLVFHKSYLFLLFFIDALTDILDAFVISENAAKMRMARENAGNDMLKVMQTVFPITVQIQMDVIKKYGFTADGDGRFTVKASAYYNYCLCSTCPSIYTSKVPSS